MDKFEQYSNIVEYNTRILERLLNSVNGTTFTERILTDFS